jgi:hypothetical protein
MGIAYRCAAELRCTLIVWDRDVTPEQWTTHIERLVNDPAWASCPRALIDLTTVGDHEGITDDVGREMAKRWRAAAPDVGSLKFAILPNGAWDQARTFEEELESFPGIHTMLFNDMGTASIWLGIDYVAARRVLADVRAEIRAEDPPRSN